MYEAVEDLLDENPEIVGSIVEFGNSSVKFSNTVSTINNKEKVRQTVASGKTEVKQSAHDKLITGASEIAAGLFTFASKNDLIELKTLSDEKDYTLKKLKGIDLYTKCVQLYEAAEKYVIQLANYGVKPEDLEAFKTLIDGFKSSIGDKESSMGQKKGAGVSLAQLFRTADKILKEELDRFAEKVKAKNPSFYEEYNAVRVIKNLGTRHRPGKGDSDQNGK
jgi:hypothetical protein